MMKTLGTYADQLYDLQDQIKAKKEEVLVLEKARNDLKKLVIDAMVRNDQTLSAGLVGKLQIEYKKIPVVKPENWDFFYEYVHNYRAYHLLHKRLSMTAVLEELEDGQEIPVDIVTIKSLKITKR